MVTFGATIPAIPSADMGRSVAFYRDRLGFELVHQEEGFAIVRRDEATIHLWAATDEGWREKLDPERPVRTGAESFIAGTASCRIRVQGSDELFAAYGALDVLPVDAVIQDQWWGDRDFHVLDPDGNLVTFFEPGGQS
jgi:catechol 2,3-dioxygenase-like lactoylglutathione lyase family enzyme